VSDHPKLTTEVASQVTGALRAQAQAAKDSIASDWYFVESHRTRDTSAVQSIIDGDVVALERNAPDIIDNGDFEDSWWGHADDTQARLQALTKKSFAEELRIEVVALAAAAKDGQLVSSVVNSAKAQIKAGASDIADGAQQVADDTRKVLGSALSFTWSALPTAAKVGLVLGVVGLSVYVASRAVTVVRVVKGAPA
jgi:ElaB/YqjD/DUF883 family membrane-anchored ribosome-binding protein